MQQLDQIIAEATRAIESAYFLLPIDGGDPVFRERVYCYELYHQMRLRWPSACEFMLNGEVDKAAHPILRRLGVGGSKPDFLVHRPGQMRGNHAIIEVKPCVAARDGIGKDLKTLSNFVNHVGYRRAIYLIYGGLDIDRTLDKIREATVGIDSLAPVELWLHREVGTAAACHSVLGQAGGHAHLE
jgi:hypothetical protein